MLTLLYISFSLFTRHRQSLLCSMPPGPSPRKATSHLLLYLHFHTQTVYAFNLSLAMSSSASLIKNLPQMSVSTDI